MAPHCEGCAEFPGNSYRMLASITFSRTVYTFSWFDAAAASPTLISHQHYTYSQLGLMLAAFMVGAGLFQVPAGIFSARRGAVRAVSLGLTLVAAGSLASTISPNPTAQVAARLLTGVGAAFYFAPAMVVVSGLFEGRSGLMIGLYNAAFNLGGGIALFTLTPAAAFWGWRTPYLVTALLTLVALAQHQAVFGGLKEEAAQDWSGVAETLTSRLVWGVALGTLGVSLAYYVASQFAVDYAADALRLGPTRAGLLSSLLLFGGLAGGPALGSLSDRARDRRAYAAVATLLSALSLAAFSYQSATTLAFAAFALGFFDSAAYTVAYAIPAEQVGRRYAPLAVGLTNSVGITVGALGVALFGRAIPLVGYTVGWTTTALAAALTTPALFLAKRKPV